MLVQSSMLTLGTVAPGFELPDTMAGMQLKKLADLRGDKATVVMFICNHCPYVKHIQEQLVVLAHDYQHLGVSFAAISANDIGTHPQDGPEHMAAEAEAHGYPFPYLYDESQEVAKAYKAECTPDFFVFDAALALIYRGRLDASTPGNGEPVTGQDVRAALSAVIAAEPVSDEQLPSMGCNIKWKSEA